MKNIFLIIFGSALLSLGSSGVAQAAILGTHNLSTAGGSADKYTDYQLTLTVGSASDRYPTNAPLFDGLKVTPSDVGRTFTVNAATDSDFNQFANFLTDGNSDAIQLKMGSGTLGSAGSTLGASGNLFGGKPDLAGNQINSISMRINSFNLDSPGTDPNGDGVWTDEAFNITLIVEGEPLSPNKSTAVPEASSTLGVLAFGAFGSGLMLRRLRSRHSL